MIFIYGACFRNIAEYSQRKQLMERSQRNVILLRIAKAIMHFILGYGWSVWHSWTSWLSWSSSKCASASFGFLFLLSLSVSFDCLSISLFLTCWFREWKEKKDLTVQLDHRYLKVREITFASKICLILFLSSSSSPVEEMGHNSR